MPENKKPLRLKDPGEIPSPCFPENLKGSPETRLWAANYNYHRWLFNLLFNKQEEHDTDILLRMDEYSAKNSKSIALAESFGILAQRILKEQKNGKDSETLQKLGTPETPSKLQLALRFYKTLNQKRGKQQEMKGSTLSFLSELCAPPSETSFSHAEAVIGFQHAIHLLALGETNLLKRPKNSELKNRACGWKSTPPWEASNTSILEIPETEWFDILTNDWTFPIESDAPQKGPELAAWIACHPQWPSNLKKTHA